MASKKMLQPRFYNQALAFNNQFYGMTLKPFTYKDFEETRECLVSIIHGLFSEKDKEFLLSFKAGHPKWELSKINRLESLPAIKWKLLNIQKLAYNNPKKHIDLIHKLEKCLNLF